MLSFPELHEKGWGHELWITNNSKYCGKVLVFKKGKKCSFHYHKVKNEHFYVQSGKILLRYSKTDDYEHATKLVMVPGNVFYVPSYLRHQMEALEDTELFEFSTYHMEEDSYRIIKGD